MDPVADTFQLASFWVPSYLLGVANSLLCAHDIFCLSVYQLMDNWLSHPIFSLNICQWVFTWMYFHYCQVCAQLGLHCQAVSDSAISLPTSSVQGFDLLRLSSLLVVM